jgi:3D (Asp-Asp-Asp) domain-containing protein
MDDDNVREILPVLRVLSFIPFFLFFGSLLYFLFSGFEDSIYEKKGRTEYSQPMSDHDNLPLKKIEGFRITAYCSGKCCNGKWHGQTAMGRKMSYYTEKKIKIAAVDPEVIPLGTWLRYNGIYYFAADTGGYIKGKRIDLLMDDHESTVEFGVKNDQTIEIISVESVVSQLIRFIYEPGVFKISYLDNHTFIKRSVKDHIH